MKMIIFYLISFLFIGCETSIFGDNETTNISSTKSDEEFIPICDRSNYIQQYLQTKLDIECNTITEDNLEIITRLDLSKGNITELKQGDFNSFPNLQFLYLNNNQINEISEKVFVNLTALESLDLQSNKLTSLGESIFTDLNLGNLYLNNNDISELSADSFKGLNFQLVNGSYTTVLNLYGNELKSLPDGVFDDLTGLRDLYLSNNKLEELSEGIFDKITNLNYLHLENNQLTTLPVNFFNELSSLTFLNLTGNNFTDAEKDRIKEEVRALTNFSSDWDSI